MNITYESNPCLNCNSLKLETVYEGVKYIGGNKEILINVSLCTVCGFAFNNPRLTEDGLNNFYKFSNLASGQVYRDESNHGHYPKLHKERAEFLKRHINPKLNSCLDIGCGNGGFLTAINSILPNFKIFGLDPSLQAVENCNSKGIKVFQGSIDSFSLLEKKFDIVSLISVLEHLPDPKKSLNQAKSMLNENGILYLEVPNTLQPECSLTGFFNVEHIVHFSPYTLLRMLQELGFLSYTFDHSCNSVIRVVASLRQDALSYCFSANLNNDILDLKDSIKKYILDEQRIISKLTSKVDKTLQEWKQNNFIVALYGAGMHSLELSTYLKIENLIDYIIDGDQNKQGKTFLFKDVISPEEILNKNIDAILISSARFIDEITRTAKKFGKEDLIIETCYE